MRIAPPPDCSARLENPEIVGGTMGNEGTSLTERELLVLGLLAEEDRYGYQIDTEIKRRSMRVWTTIGFSSIYYTLSQLEQRGLLTSREGEGSKGPKRRVFSITHSGRERLVREAMRQLGKQIPLPTSFYLGLALIKHLDPSDALAAVEDHRRSVKRRLRALRERRLTLGSPGIALDMLGLGIALAEAEAEWLEGFIQRFSTTPAHGKGGDQHGNKDGT
jgi:DNA-binding PadR family transcriptional regulator